MRKNNQCPYCGELFWSEAVLEHHKVNCSKQYHEYTQEEIMEQAYKNLEKLKKQRRIE